MITKAIACAILCLFLAQACLARPENAAIMQLRETTSIRASCVDNLKQVAVSVAGMITSILNSNLVFLKATIGTVQCIVSGNFIDCEKKVLDNLVDGVTSVFGEFVKAVQDLLSSGMESVKSCLGLKALQFVEPLLITFVE